jgi:hypothetical protein
MGRWSTPLVAHADWSVDARKRWLAVARPLPGGWHIAHPVLVGEPETLIARLQAQARERPVLLGLDLPLGVPRAYAARHAAGHPDFPAFLRALSGQPDFFRVCLTLDEISGARPFYPARGMAGMTRAAHAAALGLADGAALARACDRATAERPAGAPPFWTLGANQSGKAGLHAWRSVLLPALHSPVAPKLWPFEGRLHSLLSPAAIVVAETYPAEAMRHLGLRISGSKRRQADRLSLAAPLLQAMAALNAAPDAVLGTAIAAGFGTDPAAEDRLDCVLGALCLLNVLEGNRPDDAPDDPWVRRWEGWVLGQTALPLLPPTEPVVTPLSSDTGLRFGPAASPG